MKNYENHTATNIIREWINSNNIEICTINDIWQKALKRDTDIIKDENRATILDVHKCCKSAGLIKRTVWLDGKNYRVLVTPDYTRSNL